MSNLIYLCFYHRFTTSTAHLNFLTCCGIGLVRVGMR